MPVFRLQKRSLVFPPASLADDSYGGLLAVGGDYRAERLVEAYSHGIFPWPEPSVTDEIRLVLAHAALRAPARQPPRPEVPGARHEEPEV